MVDEVVRNQIEPGVEQREEGAEARQATLLDPATPETNAPQSILLRAGRVEDRRQLLAQSVGMVEHWAVCEQTLQAHLLFGLQIGFALAERPESVFEVIL